MTIDEKVKEDFANQVFERFRNPFIDHQWLSITVQYTSKMKMRNMPLLLSHYELSNIRTAAYGNWFCRLSFIYESRRRKKAISILAKEME